MKILYPPARVWGFSMFQGSSKDIVPRELARRGGVWFLGTPRRLRRLPPRLGLRPSLVLHRGCAPTCLRQGGARLGLRPREVLGSAYGLGRCSARPTASATPRLGLRPSLVLHRGCAPTCLRQGGARLGLRPRLRLVWGCAPASSCIGAAPRPAFGREVLGSAYGLGYASSGAAPQPRLASGLRPDLPSAGRCSPRLGQAPASSRSRAAPSTTPPFGRGRSPSPCDA